MTIAEAYRLVIITWLSGCLVGLIIGWTCAVASTKRNLRQRLKDWFGIEVEEREQPQ